MALSSPPLSVAASSEPVTPRTTTSGCCPCEPCFCIPPRLRELLPPSFRTLHDWTHASLFLAIAIGFAFTVRDALLVWERGCMSGAYGYRRYRSYCAVEILDTIFLLPCTVQLAILVGAYGDRCQHVARAAAQQKLAQAYNSMIEEMDVQLQRACDSNVFLAERAFFDKRRDFLHFLENCASTASQVPIEDREELVESLRDLIQLWLRIYSEASIDPTGRPLELDPSNALDRCGDLELLLRTAQGLVRSSRAAVVASARFREDLNAMARLRDAASSAGGEGQSSGSGWEARVSLEVGVQELRRTLRLSQKRWLSERCCSWLRCCTGPCRCHCGMLDPEETECEISCWCCGLTILSTDHALILIALMAGLTLLSAHVSVLIWDSEATWARSVYDTIFDVAPLALYMACLLFLLAKIEGISTLLVLKRHIQQMVDAQRKVDALREGLVNYWLEVTDLTEFWLHRTMPRLDLMKEMHCQIGQSRPQKWLAGMQEMNSRLQWLEDSLGEARDWWEARDQGAMLQPLGPRVDRILQTRTFMVLGEGHGSPDSFSYKVDVLMGGFDMEFADEVCGNRRLSACIPPAGAIADGAAGSSAGGVPLALEDRGAAQPAQQSMQALEVESNSSGGSSGSRRASGGGGGGGGGDGGGGGGFWGDFSAMVQRTSRVISMAGDFMAPLVTFEEPSPEGTPHSSFGSPQSEPLAAAAAPGAAAAEEGRAGQAAGRLPPSSTAAAAAAAVP